MLHKYFLYDTKLINVYTLAAAWGISTSAGIPASCNNSGNNEASSLEFTGSGTGAVASAFRTVTNFSLNS